MFQEAFKKLDQDKTISILEEINPLLENMTFDNADTVIMALDIPFYKGFKLLEIADHTTLPPNKRFVVHRSGKSVVLNFSNEAIYSLNKNAPISLNEERIEDYVRFFFSYVHGKHGRFLVIEGIDDIKWKEDPPPVARKAISKMIVPITLLEVQEDGGYYLEASMVFKDSLYRTNIDVTKEGTVNLISEELLLEDMPLIDDIFGQ